jgi:hypothetical protein
VVLAGLRVLRVLENWGGWREALELRVMEIMDEDANAARITSLRERREHLRQRLASLHAEHALVENELASLQGSPGVVEAADVPIEDRVTCKHLCAHHTALMDPAVWRNLPEEVVQMVFARLPLHQIVRLQCLSKAWRWKVTAAESGFRRLCASAGLQKPNMFALADEALHGMGIVSIKLFDAEAHKWHVFEMTLQPQFYCETMSACDGGLVCFVSRMLNRVANPLLIVVLNPLTKEYKVLPTLASLNKVQPQMVQLIMDRETKCYKVVLVGKKNRRTGTVLAKVYSSATGRWSNPDPVPEQLIFGYHFRWTADEDDQLAAERVGPCAYACHEAEFLKLGDHVIPSLDSCKGYALVNDRLFVLHYETRHQRCRSTFRPDEDGYTMLSRFVLSEYQGQRIAPYWVRVRVHDCTPLDRPAGMFPLSENFQIRLYACRNSLLITVENNEFAAFKLVRIFLYDLFTYKWQEIPAVPGGADELNQPMIQAAMCELHWDAVP